MLASLVTVSVCAVSFRGSVESSNTNFRYINPVFPNLSDVAVPLTSLFISYGTP
jgi:hypothetical protein